jgi:hypothetical protein
MKPPLPLPKALVLVLALLFAGVLAACLPAETTPLPPEPTATAPAATETPTPTVVWFPATATYTPFPTPVITPTLDLRPAVGEVLFEDDFAEGKGWTLGKTPAGSAALGKNELTLHVSQPEGYVFSVRQDQTFKDFYAEVLAAPSICREGDEYGLLLRVSPSIDFYRFSLTCQGQYRLDKFLNGAASSPQPLTLSGAVPPGAPSQSRLGVWAKGKEMRFYVNGEYLFTLNDGSLQQGALGVFARAAGENVVTVTFSELVVKRAR